MAKDAEPHQTATSLALTSLTATVAALSQTVAVLSSRLLSLEGVVTAGFDAISRQQATQNGCIDTLQLDKAHREGRMMLVRDIGVVCSAIVGLGAAAAVIAKLLGVF